MLLQNSMPIGLPKIIEMLIKFLVVTGYCLIMKALERRNICYEKDNKRFIKNRKGIDKCLYLGES